MEKKDIQEAIKAAISISPKRKFKQTVDMIVNLKGLDLKKPDHQLDFFTELHYPLDKKVRICGLVDVELTEGSKKTFDKTIPVEDFAGYGKKEAKKLAREFDFFVAQATIMPKVAQAFGRFFGPLGKMPNPKAGCVVPPNANLEQVKKRLQKMVRVKVKTHLAMQIAVGKEDTKIEELTDNIYVIYDQLIHHLPLEKNNVRNTMVKLTMGKPIKIGEAEIEEESPKGRSKKKKAVKPKAEETKKETEAKKEAEPEEKETPVKKAKPKTAAKKSKEEPDTKEKKEASEGSVKKDEPKKAKKVE